MYQQYTANHKKWDHVGNLTPNIEISEGIRPAEELIPAFYLPLVRFDKYLEDYFVVSAGKVVALDSNGYVVPAGLKLQLAAYKAAFDGAGTDYATQRAAGRAAVDALAGVLNAAYTSIDVAQPNINGPALLHAGGTAVVAGDYVVEGMLTVVTSTAVGGEPIADLTGVTELEGPAASTEAVTVSFPIGIAPYNYFRWAGGVHGGNPSGFNFHNYNMQHQLAVLCDYYIELPRSDDKADSVFDGIALLFDAPLTLAPGDFLTFDAGSDMIAGGSDCTDIVGQAWKIDTGFPKDYLERVRTAYSGLGDLDKMPGSVSGGLPDNITYAGGTAAKGVVRINLINR